MEESLDTIEELLQCAELNQDDLEEATQYVIVCAKRYLTLMGREQ